MDGERLLDGLNEAQLAAVTTPSADAGPIIVLAGAGSGKTRVLTRRIAWRVLRGDADPKRILTLTFTRKAAEELRQRQRQLGLRDHVPAGTFHGIALTQLRQRWAERRQVPPTLLNAKVRFLSQLVPRRPGVEIVDVMAEIDWARARMVEPDDYPAAAVAAGRTPPIPAADVGELMVRFRQEKRRKRVVDFDDLLTLAIRDLRADPDYAAAVRWRHRHFFVDEFQDVNPLQQALLDEWRGGRADLFVVGDPNQAIYAWNGADPSLLDRMADDPAATVIELSDNYRSTPQILTLADAALGQKRTRRLQAHLPDGPRPTLMSYGTDRAEADGDRRCHPGQPRLPGPLVGSGGPGPYQRPARRHRAGPGRCPHPVPGPGWARTARLGRGPQRTQRHRPRRHRPDHPSGGARRTAAAAARADANRAGAA